MPVTVGVAVGFCSEELKPAGPVHTQVVALLEFECNVTVPPIHIGAVLVAPVDEGDGVTLAVVVFVALQPLTEYVVTTLNTPAVTLVVGVKLGEVDPVLVVAATPAAPLHVYNVGDPSDASPEGVALKVKFPPRQIALVDGETATVGCGATE